MNFKKHGLILVIFVLLASGVNGHQGGSIETTEDLKERAPNVPETRIYLGHFGIGGGYAYKKEEVLSSRIAPLFS